MEPQDHDPGRTGRGVGVGMAPSLAAPTPSPPQQQLSTAARAPSCSSRPIDVGQAAAMLRPASPPRPVSPVRSCQPVPVPYRPEDAVLSFRAPATVFREDPVDGHGQLLYRVGKIAPLSPTFSSIWVREPPQRPGVSDLRLCASQRSVGCYRWGLDWAVACCCMEWCWLLQGGWRGPVVDG